MKEQESCLETNEQKMQKPKAREAMSYDMSYISHSDSSSWTHRERSVSQPPLQSSLGVMRLVLANKIWAEEMGIITSSLRQWRASVTSPPLFSKMTLETTGRERWFTNGYVHTHHLGVSLKCRSWFWVGGLKFLTSNKQLNYADASGHTFE